MDKESIMIQWDMYRKQIAEGDKSSEPRDWFESFLDEIERLEAEIRIAINMCDIIIQFGGATTAMFRLKESLQKALEGK